eukprot:3086656-Rhodomonas_salina.1
MRAIFRYAFAHGGHRLTRFWGQSDTYAEPADIWGAGILSAIEPQFRSSVCGPDFGFAAARLHRAGDHAALLPLREEGRACHAGGRFIILSSVSAPHLGVVSNNAKVQRVHCTRFASTTNLVLINSIPSDFFKHCSCPVQVFGGTPVSPNDMPSTYSSQLRNLVARMLHKQPERRPTITQCLEVVNPLLPG